MKVRIRFLSVGLHILIILAVSVLAVVALFYGLDHYTRHGDAVEVPDVSELYHTDADAVMAERNLRSMVVDSMYIDDMPRGVVLDQVPRAGSIVKSGRTIYLTINALSPRRVTLPQLANLSYRQAEAVINGLGLASPQVIYWNSEYKDLVLNVTADGRPVEAGDRIPVTAHITLAVGNGIYAPSRKTAAGQDSLLVPTDTMDVSSDVLSGF